MKKLTCSIAASVVLLSCSKIELQQTRDTVKSADSLFKSVNHGVTTLDSISAIVRDSARYNRVIVPEIEKTKKSVEKTIRENANTLDSLSSTIKKVKVQINKGSAILKTVDSANKKLRGEGNVFDKLSTITETISKVTKKTASTPAQQDTGARQDSATTNVQYPGTYSQQPNAERVIKVDPLVKKASLEISVSKTEEARSSLMRILRSNGADVVTENFTDAEGIKKQYILAKVPLKNFEHLVNEISSGIGNTVSKSTESDGFDYRANQMCDVAVTFSEDRDAADAVAETSPTPATFGERSSAALKKGFKSFGEFIIIILPFLPFALTAGLIWYFVARAKRRRQDRKFAAQQEVQNPNGKSSSVENITPEIQQESTEKQESAETDYSRFMPK